MRGAQFVPIGILTIKRMTSVPKWKKMFSSKLNHVVTCLITVFISFIITENDLYSLHHVISG